MAARKVIEDPPVGKAGERIITLAVVGFFAIYLSMDRATPGWLLATFLFLALTALCVRAVQPLHLCLFCTLWLLIPLLLPPLSKWPLYKVTPLVVYAGVVGSSRHLRKSVLWIRPGRLGQDIWLLVSLIVVLSSAALLVWTLVCRPDLGPSRDNIPTMPLWLLPLAGVAFALVNSAVEEAIFRGIFLQALDSAVGAGITSLVIQAVIFGWLHYSEVGFPKGLVGVTMASVYGLFLGYLRYRSRGILAPWLAHAGTDIAVFTIVATSVS
ncbi:MAG: CPBP family intramembrane metalloprotease [Deltaproteobacteria bacterium]|nr:CPBP family intramembrane metalloprotease [Deltaproteobacteria bacterium]